MQSILQSTLCTAPFHFFRRSSRFSSVHRNILCMTVKRQVGVSPHRKVTALPMSSVPSGIGYRDDDENDGLLDDEIDGVEEKDRDEIRSTEDFDDEIDGVEGRAQDEIEGDDEDVPEENEEQATHSNNEDDSKATYAAEHFRLSSVGIDFKPRQLVAKHTEVLLSHMRARRYPSAKLKQVQALKHYLDAVEKKKLPIPELDFSAEALLDELPNVRHCQLHCE